MTNLQNETEFFMYYLLEIIVSKLPSILLIFHKILLEYYQTQIAGVVKLGCETCGTLS